MAIGALLRMPVRATESYARPGEEQHLFPGYSSYLSLPEILQVFPDGLITRDRWQAEGHCWRLAKRPLPGGGATYLAVLDTDGMPNGSLTGPVYSVPVDSLSSHDLSDISMGNHDTLGTSPGTASFLRATTLPASRAGRGMPALANGSANGTPSGSVNALSFCNGGIGGGMLTPVSSTPHRSCAGANPSFTTDLLTATETPVPLDRYKALVRLFAGVRRARESLSLPDPAPAAQRSGVFASGIDSWDSAHGHDLMKQVLMVGECLAKFGTADFGDRSASNSSRAITTKDYARLLRMYLEGVGAVFCDDFIDRLPLSLQDEALTVRTLLQTRCETNEVLFSQLVRHVGQEGPQGGGAVVFNHSSVTANPTNHMLAAPKTHITAWAGAFAKVASKRRLQVGAAGAVAVVALFALRKRLGGSSGRKGRNDEDSDWEGSRRRRRGGSVMDRLLDERLGAERTAVRFLAACHDELRRAQHNDELLQRDWRLGGLRLAAPLAGPHPPGYQPVEAGYCSLGRYLGVMDAMEGRLPAGSGADGGRL